MTAGHPDFIGQDEAWREWESALASERMHHAWLLGGPKGLGKRAFASAAAAALVRRGAGASQQPPIEAHPDILLLDHLPKDEKEAKKRTDGQPYETKRNITIEQIRAMQARLTTRPTIGERRAIIIHPADDLEKGAANALLKSLEEPPVGTHFLLIADEPGRLVPTIRSRCRILRFAPLEGRHIDAVLRRDVPEADAALRAAAVDAANGSPGLALAFIEQGLGPLHALMRKTLREGDPGFQLRGAMAQEIGARPPRERLMAVLDLARAALCAELSRSERSRQLRLIEAHGKLTSLAAQAPTYNFDPGLLVMEIGGLLAMAAPPREAATRT